MERVEFAARFLAASKLSIDGASEVVYNALPESTLYLIKPNSGSIGLHPLEDDQKYFPEDTLTAAKGYMHPVNAEAAIEFLFRNDFVPQWINVSVNAADEAYTYVFMRCSARFTNSDELYHASQGISPFRIGSTTSIPALWESEITRLGSANVRTKDLVAKYGKFWLPDWLGYHDENDPWRRSQNPFVKP